ncbi:hypothetical protein DL766_006491 [Monosporascus sp. MC13-8B]|uniref:2EXR domain-containing protein n=1 Tax=Monosporascus cannonballus TaxID=155416 RepID=A0ABY0GUR8_9PEZI|nr:hypothetical protein DL763_011110 [Monosporascus cannonballus]RYO77446.1 hypothetical protein DL762_009264 [Monosporascus cannonballus]RYP27217.1 hypothetical protein DL766_006491 [Monosporascus sp. MC13-8B]
MSGVPENIQELYATYLATTEYTNEKFLELIQVLGEALEAALVSRAALREAIRQAPVEITRVVRFTRPLAPPISEEIDEQARRGRVLLTALDHPCGGPVLHVKNALERELGSLIARTRISDGGFSYFPLLPTQIRRSIWRYACVNEARDRCIMVDLYMKRVLLTDNLRMKVGVVCRESRGIAVHGSIFSNNMRAFRMAHVDSRRRLFGKGTKRTPHFTDEAGLLHFSPEYDTFVYGVRYDANKSAPGKRYSRFATQLIYGSELEYTVHRIPAHSIFGIANLPTAASRLTRSRAPGNDFMRRLLPDNPELREARKFLLNAGPASPFLDVA